jgi:hypothetical protein
MMASTFCILSNQQCERELVAWNASEAQSHTGEVFRLRIMLEEMSNREGEDAITFDSLVNRVNPPACWISFAI